MEKNIWIKVVCKNLRVNFSPQEKNGFLNDLLPDGQGELSGSAFTLSGQKSSTLPVSESTFCNTARYAAGEPAGGKKDKKRTQVRKKKEVLGL